MWLNKYIYGFWVSYGLIKIKVSESSLPVTITHDVDLENKFAGNPLLKDNSEDWHDLTNYTSQMLCFLYNYHYWSKLNSHRGLWGIFATSPQSKDSMMAFWESVHASLCLFFRETAVLYFLPIYRYALSIFRLSFTKFI